MKSAASPLEDCFAPIATPRIWKDRGLAVGSQSGNPSSARCHNYRLREPILLAPEKGTVHLHLHITCFAVMQRVMLSQQVMRDLSALHIRQASMRDMPGSTSGFTSHMSLIGAHGFV